MTFRSAALIHKRQQQPRRRIIPAVTVAVVALVAAALFLFTTIDIQADVGREEEQAPTPDCSGLTAISLTASADHVSQGVATTPSVNCDYTLEVGQLPSTGRSVGAEPCLVSAMPRLSGTTGVGVRVSTTGDCNDVEIRWTVNVPGSSAGTLQQSSGYASAYAKVWGEDPIGWDVFYNKSKVTWTYTINTVSNGSHYPTDWVLWGGWSVESYTSSFIKQGNTGYDGYNNVKFKGFQFTKADTEATLYARPGGAFTCTFDVKWKWKPIGFDDDSLCDVE